MIHYVLSGLVLAMSVGSSAWEQAETPCNDSEPACILADAWTAALVLPPQKLERVKPLFLEVAAESGDPDLLTDWQARLALAQPRSHSAYEDFGWQKAEPVLSAHGVDGLIDRALRKQAPLNFARGDALLAAGKQLIETDANGAKRLNQTLLDMVSTASSFEAPELAHAASELAMYRCDLVMFDRALARTHAPDNLRYAFWRARMTGDALSLRRRIRDEADDQDTRHVRQVLGGYRAILELGYCQQGTVL